MPDQNAKRLIATVPPDTFGKLDALAKGPRFAGNRSAAVAWCIEVGAVVLTDQTVRDRLFASPADALAAFTATAADAGQDKAIAIGTDPTDVRQRATRQRHR